MSALPWAGRMRVDLSPTGEAQYYLDGVGPLPGYGALADFIGGPDEALACFGKALATGTYDFGPGVGRKQVLIMEKWIAVLDPSARYPWDMQGVHTRLYEPIRQALGVKP